MKTFQVKKFITNRIEKSESDSLSTSRKTRKGRRTARGLLTYSRVTKLATVNSKEVLLVAVDSKQRIGERIWSVRSSRKVLERVRKEKSNARLIARKDKECRRKFEEIREMI